MKQWAAFLFITFALSLASQSYGADIESRLKALEETITAAGKNNRGTAESYR